MTPNMSRGKNRVFVGLYFRQGITANPLSTSLNHARFHWAIRVEPKGSNGRGTCYEVKEEDVYVNVLGSGGWRYYRTEAEGDPMLMGRIMVGKLPRGVGAADVDGMLKEVPLPREGAEPLENCVSWTERALGALRGRGWVEEFDIGGFMEHARERVTLWFESGVYPEKMSIDNYTQRPM